MADKITTIVTKINHAQQILKRGFSKYKKIAVGCSFGKDSIVTVHLARSVNKRVPVFSIMTMHKPKESLKYLVEMNRLLKLNVTVYLVSKKTPDILKKNRVKVVLLDPTIYLDMEKKSMKKNMKHIYEVDPDGCCRMLKVEPTQVAVKNLNAWITGLRRTEGRTRTDYKEFQKMGSLMKINPILDFEEVDIWKYLAMHNLPVHPWYALGYRSLGCEPCSKLVDDAETERAGRWLNTSKCGGECGIHTIQLK